MLLNGGDKSDINIFGRSKGIKQHMEPYRKNRVFYKKYEINFGQTRYYCNVENRRMLLKGHGVTDRKLILSIHESGGSTYTLVH